MFTTAMNFEIITDAGEKVVVERGVHSPENADDECMKGWPLSASA